MKWQTSTIWIIIIFLFLSGCRCCWAPTILLPQGAINCFPFDMHILIYWGLETPSSIPLKLAFSGSVINMTLQQKTTLHMKALHYKSILYYASTLKKYRQKQQVRGIHPREREKNLCGWKIFRPPPPRAVIYHCSAVSLFTRFLYYPSPHSTLDGRVYVCLFDKLCNCLQPQSPTTMPHSCCCCIPCGCVDGVILQ